MRSNTATSSKLFVYNMNRSLYNSISENYFANQYREVINLWEKSKENISIDLIDKYDYLLVDAVCNSYYQNKQYHEALVLIDKILDFLFKVCDKNNNHYYKQIDYYLIIKSVIYREIAKFFEEYKTLIIRKRLFNETDFDDYITAYENVLYKKKIFPILFYIPLAIFLMVIILHRYFDFSFFSSLSYYIFLVIGLIWIIFSSFYSTNLKNIILRTMKNIIIRNHVSNML